MKFKTNITVVLILLLTLNSCIKKQKITKVMYADIQLQIDAYSASAMEIWADNEKLALSYFNDSIPNLVAGSYISDYMFNLVNDSLLNTRFILKPIYLQVGSRSCPPCRAEIPALNDIVKKYSKDVSFMLLFENDAKETVLKAQNEYHQDINLVYYSKEENNNRKTNDPSIFSGFKHLMKALPTNYLVNKDRQIIKLSGGASVPGRRFIDSEGKETTLTKEEAYLLNYKKLEEEMKLLLSYR